MVSLLGEVEIFKVRNNNTQKEVHPTSTPLA